MAWGSTRRGFPLSWSRSFRHLTHNGGGPRAQSSHIVQYARENFTFQALRTTQWIENQYDSPVHQSINHTTSLCRMHAHPIPACTGRHYNHNKSHYNEPFTHYRSWFVLSVPFLPFNLVHTSYTHIQYGRLKNLDRLRGMLLMPKGRLILIAQYSPCCTTCCCATGNARPTLSPMLSHGTMRSTTRRNDRTLAMRSMYPCAVQVLLRARPPRFIQQDITILQYIHSALSHYYSTLLLSNDVMIYVQGLKTALRHGTPLMPWACLP